MFPPSYVLLSKSITGRQGKHAGPQMPEGPVHISETPLSHCIIKYPIKSAPFMRRRHMATHSIIYVCRKDVSQLPTASFKSQIASDRFTLTPDLSLDQIKRQDLHISLTLNKIHMREQGIISSPWHFENAKYMCILCTVHKYKYVLRRRHNAIILRSAKFYSIHLLFTNVTFFNSEMTLCNLPYLLYLAEP